MKKPLKIKAQLRIRKGNNLSEEVSIIDLKKKMLECAENLDFERAAEIRDKIKVLEKKKWALMKVYKKALVTGGAQRIGASIAFYLAKWELM